MKSSTKRRFKKRKGLLGKAISLIEEGGRGFKYKVYAVRSRFRSFESTGFLDLKVARIEPTSRWDSTYVGHVRRVCSRVEASQASDGLGFYLITNSNCAIVMRSLYSIFINKKRLSLPRWNFIVISSFPARLMLWPYDYTKVCHHRINRFSVNRITRVIGFFFSVWGRKSSYKSGFFSIFISKIHDFE